MAPSIKHKFVSAKVDGSDPTQVRPSNWNDEHDLKLGTGNLLGRTSAGNGAAEEIAPGAGLVMASQKLSVSGTRSTVASAATTDIGAATTMVVDVTGAATITSLGTTPNCIRFVRFSGAATLTHNATTLGLPGAQNIVTAAGDTALFTSDSSGNWKCVQYQRIAQSPIADFIAVIESTIALRVKPVGETFYMAGTVAPAGSLKKNGALISRTTYASLWAYAQASGRVVADADWLAGDFGAFSSGDGTTTFRIPDDRGVFLRCWDDARGVDTGRAILSYQGDDNKAHTHKYNRPNSSAVRYLDGGGSCWNSTVTEFDSGSSGGSEARPKNIALLACIKY